MDDASGQVVLKYSASLTSAAAREKSVFADTLIIPSYTVAASIVVLLALTVFHSRPAKRLQARVFRSGYEAGNDLDSQQIATNPPAGFLAEVQEHVTKHGGPTIFSHMVARLVGSLAMLGLSTLTFLMDEKSQAGVLKKHHRKHGKAPKHGTLSKSEWIQAAMCITFAYTSLLGLVSTTARPRIARLVTKHLVFILLVTFGVYAFRDLWPLGTYDKHPADAGEGWILWLKIGILSLIAVVIPATIPRQYVPFDSKDPESQPTVEQTTSFLSLILYSYLDPVIALAYRVPNIAASALPPIADYDKAKNLAREGLPILDPIKSGKSGHIFWGLMKIYRREYIILALMLIVKVVAGYASPIGINRLLNYLEKRGEGELIRPWVWIVWLFIGPTVGSIAFQWYIYIAMRTLVRTESLLTQLIFEHALRMRVKHETAEAPGAGAKSNGAPNEGATAPTPTGSSSSGVYTPLGSLESAKTSSALIQGKQKSKDIQPVEEAPKPKPTTTNNSLGKINNLVTTDLNNITGARNFLLLVVSVPLQIILSVTFLYNILGWSAFVGMGVIFAMLPVPSYITKLLQRAQKESMKKTDARVQAVSETMSVLRMVKMFGWEQKMAERVAEKREIELQWIWKLKVLSLLNNNFNHVIPVVTMIASFSVYTLIMKQELTASRVFSAMTVFEMLRTEVSMSFFFINTTIRGKVSLDRVNEFLHNTELLDSFTEKRKDATLLYSDVDDIHEEIGFRAASFTWSNNRDGTMTPSREFTLRIPDEVIFKRGCINLIVGPTGSGKTSMLMALLGEMHFIALDAKAWFNLPREPGRVAYAAQESWVQNETIRENILFGAQFDEIRYNKVIDQCGLERDLALFEAGDHTEVGEKGLTLSGGQKARITLARAVYSSADVLLLDDILAALDVHTARWVVEKCLAGDLIRGRTVLLVTHNVAMSSPIAQLVVSIGPTGVITATEPASEAFEENPELALEAKEKEEVDIKALEVADPAKSERQGGKLTVAEEMAVGHVTWSSVKLMTSAMGGQYPFIFWTVVLGGSLLSTLTETTQTWYLGYWASQYDSADHANVQVPYYLTIYSLFTVVSVLFFCVGEVVYYVGSLRASRTISKDLMNSVLGTTLRWLDTTPTSRVIARCTQDIRAVDGPIPEALSSTFDISLAMLVKLGAIVVLTPVFIIPGSIVGLLGAICGQIYMKAQLSVKRRMSNTRAPVIAHFGAAIAGLTSIRAYGAQHAFKLESMSRIDRYTTTARTFYNLNRWVSTRTEALGGLFAACVASYLVYGRDISSPSNTGFSITMAIGFSEMIIWWIRVLNDFEVSVRRTIGNSLERVQGYINIEQEPKPTEGGAPPAYWPANGDLVVEHLSARYSLDGPEVLHDLSFKINSGEHVGIVGRTGSGKSSLALSLLRCIYTEGTVYYGGIPTSSINLDALRSSITIIPQIPELLSRTMRANLDPFSEHDDVALNGALRAAGLFSLQADAEESRLTLETAVSNGGGNLSVGQRQILALARAIVRESKLLILDEDYKTDNVIQASLRKELSSDVTVITVAHRLQTIMDADKIMVLDSGRIVEFDSPKILLQKDGGLLRALVDESGEKETLYAMAEGKVASSV